MAYLAFDNHTLEDYPLARHKEFILVNATGAYCSSTIVNCNTRKYHGLLVAQQPQLNDQYHVLLSSLDETLIWKEQEYELSVHEYPGTVQPKGYQHLESFIYDRTPAWTYRIGELELKKSIVLGRENEQVFICYELVNTRGAVRLRLQPFLAFREAHAVRQANSLLNRKFQEVTNGIRFDPYDKYDPLYLQFSKKPQFTPVPDWYYNIEYHREQERGYDFREDLYVPGFFEFTLKKGDQLIAAAGLDAIEPKHLKKQFRQLVSEQPVRDSFEACLHAAADQFIIRREEETKIAAGWHWFFGAWGRDSFISLPGLTLSTGKPKVAKAVFDTIVDSMHEGLFSNTGSTGTEDYNSVDAPLWFFWALQQYAAHTGDISAVWERYSNCMRDILTYYEVGTRYQIRMLENGLITAGKEGIALTWMDAIVNGQPVTPRTGMPVEINALWYNAVSFALEAASHVGDKSFVKEWKSLPDRIRQSFLTTFWDEQKGYLADCVNGGEKDWSVRPNQVIATSLPYSPLPLKISQSVLQVVHDELLTPRGLRTLARWDVRYKGHYHGNQENRDRSYHQGPAWPWLLEHFAEGYLKVYGEEGVPVIQSLYEGFEQTLFEHGIGTISEIYEGEEPYRPEGTISQAWSVAALLRIHGLIRRYEQKDVVSGKKQRMQVAFSYKS